MKASFFVSKYVNFSDINWRFPVTVPKIETYTTRQGFEECLRQNEPRKGRFYVLKPSNPKVVSRCPLHISEEMTRKVLATHKIMPAFLEHLHAFGWRERREEDASFGGGRFKIGFEPGAKKCSEFELCYTYKWAIKNGRKPDTDPFAWTMRQTSVYHKFQYNQKQSTWILVQPSDAVYSRLQAVLKEDSSASEKLVEAIPTNPLKSHLLFLSAAGENWRNYYNQLEKFFYETVCSAAKNIPPTY
jgi:hypothetical protein